MSRAKICPLILAILTIATPVFADRNLNRPGWAMTWHDEFDGTAVDESKWNIDDVPAPANNELEWYSRDNVDVDNGNLVLKSEERWINGYQYASGKVTSAGKFDQKFGRFEVRAKLPTGQGIWPAHWMLPYGHWPPEIDITEMIGSVPNRITMSVHWGPLPPGVYPWDIGQTRNADFWGPDFSQDFHSFALEWDSGWLAWQIDGIQRHSSWEGVPQETMFLILNTAVGGDWPGPPDWTTPWPQFHEIDYVRVYGRIPGDYPLLNPGFEDGEADDFPNWNRWDDGNVTRDPLTANARTGTSALQLHGRFDGTDNVSGIYQSIPARPGELWTASTWARNRPGDGLSGGNQGRLKLEFTDGDGVVISTSPLTILDSTSPEDYAQHDLTGAAPAGTAWARLVIEIFQTDDATGSINIDDSSLVRVNPVPGVLANADFEQWDGDEFVHWTHYDSNNIEQDANQAHAQSGSGAVHAWGRFDSDDNWSGVYQDLPTTADQWWEAVIFARNRPGDAAQGNNIGNLKLEFVDDSGGIVWSVTRAIINAASPESYAPFVIRAQAPASAVAARIVLEYRQFDFADGAVNFDDASLRPISAYRAWIANFIDPDSPAADPSANIDNDRQSNEAEFAARTHPADPSSFLRISSFTRNPSTGDFTVEWPAEPGVSYRIIATSDLGNWDPATPAADQLAGPLSLTGSLPDLLSSTLDLPPGTRFLRVEVAQ